MKKVLAVLGIAAMFTSAAFATPPKTAQEAIDENGFDTGLVTDITFNYDAFCTMTLTDAVEMHLLTNKESGNEVSGDISLRAIANFDYQVKAELAIPVLAGDPGTWTLACTDTDPDLVIDNDITDSTPKPTILYTKGFGELTQDTITVKVADLDMGTETNSYPGNLTVTMLAD